MVSSVNAGTEKVSPSPDMSTLVRSNEFNQSENRRSKSYPTHILGRTDIPTKSTRKFLMDSV